MPGEFHQLDERSARRHWALCAFTLLAFVCFITSCERADQTPITPTQPATPKTPWIETESSRVLIAGDDALAAELQAAIAEAQRTAESARQRFRFAKPADRRKWWIKWAAPTDTGGVEYLWVRPFSWSKHRIEGVLANDPQRMLLSAKSRGDMVSFPAEELADWVYAIEGDFSGAHEGGYTIEVISEYARRAGDSATIDDDKPTSPAG